MGKVSPTRPRANVISEYKVCSVLQLNKQPPPCDQTTSASSSYSLSIRKYPGIGLCYITRSLSRTDHCGRCRPGYDNAEQAFAITPKYS